MSGAATHRRDHPARRMRSRPFTAMLAFVLRAQDRWLQRRSLEELDDHLLADIGLKPEDVRRECGKAFWR